MTDRILSRRALNRALLARRLLLERSPLSIAGAVEQVGGLQTQYAPSGYVGLWTRLREFPRSALTAALGDRAVVQASLIRVTIHIVWSLKDGRIVLDRFEELSARDHRAVEREREALEAFNA